MVGSVASPHPLLGAVDGHYVFENTGRLVCDCDEWPMWAVTSHDLNSVETSDLPSHCEHTWTAMKRGMDATDEVVLSGVVHVPLFEKFHDVSMPVWAIRNQEKNGMVPFFYANPDWKQGDWEVEVSDRISRPIGWLDVHEGRWAIRGPLLEWLRAIYYVLPECSFKYHTGSMFSYNHEAHMKVDTRRPEVLAATAHFLKSGGICINCKDADTSDIHDLVPDI